MNVTLVDVYRNIVLAFEQFNSNLGLPEDLWTFLCSIDSLEARS